MSNITHLYHTIDNVKVTELYKIIKEVKPKRFKKSDRELTFNDPRITDFATVNLYTMWQITSVLKRTKVKDIRVTLSYRSNVLVITSNGPETFRYELPIY